MKREIYKLNDTVYHYEYGKGTIVDICYKDGFPIKVQFINTVVEFLLDGRRHVTDTHSTLSLRPYNLAKGGFSQKRPLPKLKRGDIVYVCNYGLWYIRIFAHFDINENLCYYEDGRLRNATIEVAKDWSLEDPTTK